MITIEPLVYSIRIGKGNLKLYDPYEAVCTATKISPDTVRITAMSGSITTLQMILLSKEFKRMGFKYIKWERIKDGVNEDFKRAL